MGKRTEEVKTQKKAAPPAVVQNAGNGAVATTGSGESLADWGAAPTPVSSRDIVIPKILPMQQMSVKVVKDKSAKFGELRDTANNRLCAELGEPMAFIPFFMEKVFIEFEMVKNKRQFKRVVPITHLNDDAPYSWEEDGKSFERDRTMNFYILLAEDVKKGGAHPYVLSFRRTSLRAGQTLATQMYVLNQSAGKPPAAVVMNLTTREEENDDGVYIVLDVTTARDADVTEMSEAFKWYKPLAKGALKHKVDNSDLEGGDAITDVSEVSDY